MDYTIKPRFSDTMKRLLFSFRGRINRSEFLFACLIGTGASILFVTLFPSAADSFCEGLGTSSDSIVNRSIYGCGAIALMVFIIWWPLAVSVKRLHDYNASGWRVLWGIIPFFAFLLSLWFQGAFVSTMSVVATHGQSLGFVKTIQMILFTIYLLGPFVGFLILLFRKGTSGENRFGTPPPKGILKKGTT